MIENTRFVAYHAPTAPAGRQWLAQVFNTPAPTKEKPNPGEVPFNMNFFAASRDAALKAAEDWWTTETGKATKRDTSIAARTEKARATRAANRQVAA